MNLLQQTTDHDTARSPAGLFHVIKPRITSVRYCNIITTSVFETVQKRVYKRRNTVLRIIKIIKKKKKGAFHIEEQRKGGEAHTR